jgi:uncharacterized protein
LNFVKKLINSAIEEIDESSFVPQPLLKNPHLMTIAPALLPRGFKLRKSHVETTLFPVAPGSQIRGFTHFQRDRSNCPTLILVHGLEGSSQSFYMVGLAEKALNVGLNVVRLNLRNCGGTLHLTPTLYNAGLSQDLHRVIEFMSGEYGLSDLFLIGYSLGGNLVLKASAELGELQKFVSGTVAISPPIDLEACVRALELPSNRFYELAFLWSLKRKIQQKNVMFPNCFPVSKLAQVKSVRQFDDVFTAPDGKYETADNYYRVASSGPLLEKIGIPSLIITAQDDPLVPFKIFRDIRREGIVKLLAPKYGGHAAFIQDMTAHRRNGSIDDHFWADRQIIDFCKKHSKLIEGNREEPNLFKLIR